MNTTFCFVLNWSIRHQTFMWRWCGKHFQESFLSRDEDFWPRSFQPMHQSHPGAMLKMQFLWLQLRLFRILPSENHWPVQGIEFLIKVILRAFFSMVILPRFKLICQKWQKKEKIQQIFVSSKTYTGIVEVVYENSVHSGYFSVNPKLLWNSPLIKK